MQPTISPLRSDSGVGALSSWKKDGKQQHKNIKTRTRQEEEITNYKKKEEDEEEENTWLVLRDALARLPPVNRSNKATETKLWKENKNERERKN